MKLQLFNALGFKNSISLVTNGGFESNLDGWNTFGPVSLENNTTNTLAGTGSAFVSNRTAEWNGLKQNMLSRLEKGKTYHFSAWVKLANTGPDNIRLSIKQVVGSDNPAFIPIDSVSATNGRFSLLEGDYTMPDSDGIAEIELLLNGPAIGVNFYADHVRVYEYQTPNIVASVLMDDGNGSISLGWNAELGVSYRLEQSLDLANGWTILESNLTADKSNMIWALTPDPAVSRAFWRVIKNP